MLTKQVQAFIIRRLLELRKKQLCTSTTLQQCLAKERQLEASVSVIQKCLRKHGYRWLRRAQKRKYSKVDKLLRKAFGDWLNGSSENEFNQKVSFSMDGINMGMAPTDPIERENFCRSNEEKMWRKANEYAIPELAADDKMPKQIAAERCVSFWGGIGANGAAIVCFHEHKKIEPDEWLEAVEDGALEEALETAAMPKSNGSFTVICDNERFLKGKDVARLYADCGVDLKHIPPRSPDLNPVERFWHWVRTQMRKKDLADFISKRPPLGKTAYKQRLRVLLRSRRAKEVARNNFYSLRRTVSVVVKNKGANSRG